MKREALLPFAVGAVAGVVAVTAPPFGRAEEGAARQAAGEVAPPRSAREVRGPTPYLAVANEPPPTLIVDEALPDLLDKGIVWIQYRTENCRILRCSGRTPWTFPRESATCTSTSMTCPGCGRTRATSTPSTSPECRPASTRY